jgi:hypothetical protein
MAYSRVRIFDQNGFMVDEIDVATTRSWVLNGVGRCQFLLNVYDPQTGAVNRACNLADIGYGRFILVEHSPTINFDGTFNGILPPWVGIILPPLEMSYGKVRVTAYSAEQVLWYRPMPYPFQTISGKAGAVFQQILGFCNNLGGIPIAPGHIDLSKGDHSRTLNLSGLEESQSLAKAAAMDFCVTPSIDINGRLSLIGNWYAKKGVDTNHVLDNTNLEAGDPLYTEQGQIVNWAFGFSEANTTNTRAKGVSVDNASVSACGPLARNVVFTGTKGSTDSVIQGLTDNFLSVSKNPLRTFAPKVQDVGDAFSFMDTGNTWIVNSDIVGLSNGGLGLSGLIRITAMEYDDLGNSVSFAGAIQ